MKAARTHPPTQAGGPAADHRQQSPDCALTDARAPATLRSQAGRLLPMREPPHSWNGGAQRTRSNMRARSAQPLHAARSARMEHACIRHAALCPRHECAQYARTRSARTPNACTEHARSEHTSTQHGRVCYRPSATDTRPRAGWSTSSGSAADAVARLAAEAVRAQLRAENCRPHGTYERRGEEARTQHAHTQHPVG